MVLQKSNESTEISQWVFYRAERIGPVEDGAAPLPDLQIALAFDPSGKIARAIVTPFEALPEGLMSAPDAASQA